MGAPNPRPLPELDDRQRAEAQRRIKAKSLIDDKGCWVWQMSLRSGYGSFAFLNQTWPAHRMSYLVFRGGFDHTLDIDHLCRNRACVNPNHLEPVTPRVNVLRGDTLAVAELARTHCPKGHPYSGDNLVMRPSGRRGCRACIAQWAKDSTARRAGRRVTPRVTHCKRGHLYDDENTYWQTNGSRACRECMRIRAREGRERRAS